MLANIYRKLNAERYKSNVFRLSGKKNNSFFSSSKNILRHSTALAIENKELFVKIPFSSTLSQIQIPEDEVDKLLKLDWTSLSPAEFVSNFEKFSIYTCNLDKKPDINYGNFLQTLSALSPHFYDEEVAYILKYLISWFKNKNHPKDVRNFIVEILDKECVNRFPKQNIENMLIFSQLFVNLRYGKESQFTRKSLLKLNKKAKRLSSSQLAQFMSLISDCVNLPLNLYEVEYYVEQNFEKFSLKELSEIAIGFYVNKTQIRSAQLLKHILESMLNNMEVLSNRMVLGLLKFLRFSYKSTHRLDDLFRKLFQDLETHVPRFTLITLTQILYLAAHALIYEKNLMTSIFERQSHEIENLRIKDIERIAFSLAQFNYDSSHPLYKKIVEEITSPRRQQEIEIHKKSLSCTLKYLAFVNVYPIKVLEQIMDPKHIKKAYYNKHAMNEEYFFLDQSIAAEVPNYTGPRLSDDLRKCIAKRYKAIVSNEKRSYLQSTTMKEVVATCQRILKTESGIYTDKLLPHFNFQDIIICLDEENKPISPEPILSAMSPDIVKPVFEEAKKYKWFVIIITMKKMVLNDSHEFSGILAAKYRQLKSLGYTPVVVSHYKWHDIKSHEDCEKLQEEYVSSLLNIKQPVE